MTMQLTFVDGSGDTTVIWDAPSNDKMREVIERLMKQGHSFFVVEHPNAGHVKTETLITSLEQLTQRSVVVRDETLRELYRTKALKVEQGFIATVKAELRRLFNADQVMVKAALHSPEPTQQPAPPPATTTKVLVLSPMAGG